MTHNGRLEPFYGCRKSRYIPNTFAVDSINTTTASVVLHTRIHTTDVVLTRITVLVATGRPTSRVAFVTRR